MVLGRGDKFASFTLIRPCQSVADLTALHTLHSDDLKACVESLRGQIRVRVRVWRVKQKGLPKDGVTLERLICDKKSVKVYLVFPVRADRAQIFAACSVIDIHRFSSAPPPTDGFMGRRDRGILQKN
jgi:hypothetical protein